MRWATLLATIVLAGVATARAEDAFEQPPIEYSRSQPDNGVAKLQSQIERGEVELPFDAKFGYLPALLDALRIPRQSQMLVFSKTSLQRDRISPRTPRAVYFNDEVYLGYCQSGEVMEISVADAQLGAVFYSIKQVPAARPALVRQTHTCLQCHASGQSDGSPDHMVRSVYVDSSGLPLLTEGSHRVDHTTPFENRWGGWYVTGTHGRQTHLGNLVIRGAVTQRPIDNAQGQNVSDLSPRFSTDNYLSGHSDIVALMVLEHQAFVHNLITRANFATRQALRYEAEVNRALGEPPDHRLAGTASRIKHAGEKLLKGLLFVDEAPLTAPVAGSTDFAATFTGLGPRDAQGRSLRDFDLTRRMFKYPCSYLIYTAAFDGLPVEVKSHVAERLRAVLTGQDQSKEFAHLSAADREAIWQILGETKPELWKPTPTAPAGAPTHVQ
jgi:hypothetical protein